MNIDENFINNIKDNQNKYDKIKFLQLWWKTIFQIIKIQKYLRGFLYRIKLLKLLEFKEKIVCGIISFNKISKKVLFRNFISKIKERLLLIKEKYYINKWRNLILKKSIIQKLIKLNKSKRLPKNNDKIEKNINEKKLKSASVNKRNIQKEKNKELSDDEKTRRDNKNIFKDNIFLSSNKNGLEAKRINTERNIHKIGIKANSIDKRKTKKSFNNIKNNNLNNIKSNISIKSQKGNKIPGHFSKTSANLLMNRSQNQINNNKFFNRKNPNKKSNHTKISKKNTYMKNYNNLIKNRNNKNASSFINLDNNINKFKNYYFGSSRNRLNSNSSITVKTEKTDKSVKLKKNKELGNISTHENRFRYPKLLYSFNNKNLKKAPFVKIEKYETSFDITKDSHTTKNEDTISHMRSRSMESRHKKKYKSLIQKISSDNDNNNNKRSKDDISNRNITIELLKYEDKNKGIIKSKTKMIKKGKMKKNQKSILKNLSSVNNKLKNKGILTCLNLWRIKNIKKKILNKLRSISILDNKIKHYLYKNNAHSFIESLQKIQKYKILHNNFIVYRNKVSIKIILEKIKEKYNNKKEDNLLDNNEANHNNDNDNDNDNDKINVKIEKISIIEISPYQDTKINSIIKSNYIQKNLKNKLQKLLLIKQKVIEYSTKKHYYHNWKKLLYENEPNLMVGIGNMKNFYFNYIKKNDENNKQRNNSSYHRKRVKYKQNNNNMEISFKEEKLYNKKIVNYLNNESISINKENFFNKTTNQINNYNNRFNHFYNYDDKFNHNLINNYNDKFNQSNNNYDNKFIYINNFDNIFHPRYINTNYNINPHNEDINNNINYKYNLISRSPNPLQLGVYKKKRIVNSKNSNINRNHHNLSCLIGDVNKSNFELNNTTENNKEFMNNSVVMGRRRIRTNNNDIYYPKHVSPNLKEKEPNFEVTKLYIKEKPEFFINSNFINSNMAYKKINIRYQKMYDMT